MEDADKVLGSMSAARDAVRARQAIEALARIAEYAAKKKPGREMGYRFGWRGLELFIKVNRTVQPK